MLYGTRVQGDVANNRTRRQRPWIPANRTHGWFFPSLRAGWRLPRSVH